MIKISYKNKVKHKNSYTKKQSHHCIKIRNVEHIVKLEFGTGFTDKEMSNLLTHRHQHKMDM